MSVRFEDSFVCWKMADCFCSGWPEEAACAECPASMNKDSSFPWLRPSDSSSFQFHGSPSVFPSWPTPFVAVGEDRSASVSNSHSQAEKRRRDRINAQLSTLRKLIPKSDKVSFFALDLSSQGKTCRLDLRLDRKSRIVLVLIFHY